MAKIFLVDDDPLLVRMYQTKLENDGFTVITANNGSDALTQIPQNKPDLILLDIMMPVMNGLETLKQLKAHENTKDIPVIVLTNVGGSQDDIQKGLSLGAIAYLVKSDTRPKHIVQKVKEVLQNRESSVS